MLRLSSFYTCVKRLPAKMNAGWLHSIGHVLCHFLGFTFPKPRSHSYHSYSFQRAFNTFILFISFPNSRIKRFTLSHPALFKPPPVPNLHPSYIILLLQILLHPQHIQQQHHHQSSYTLYLSKSCTTLLLVHTRSLQILCYSLV